MLDPAVGFIARNEVHGGDVSGTSSYIHDETAAGMHIERQYLPFYFSLTARDDTR
jgi:hypothetical protein